MIPCNLVVRDRSQSQSLRLRPAAADARSGQSCERSNHKTTASPLEKILRRTWSLLRLSHQLIARLAYSFGGSNKGFAAFFLLFLTDAYTFHLYN